MKSKVKSTNAKPENSKPNPSQKPLTEKIQILANIIVDRLIEEQKNALSY